MMHDAPTFRRATGLERAFTRLQLVDDTLEGFTQIDLLEAVDGVYRG